LLIEGFESPTMRTAQFSIGLGIVLAVLGCQHENTPTQTPASARNPADPSGVATDASRVGAAGGSSGGSGGAAFGAGN
jgi:hypothetical protein